MRFWRHKGNRAFGVAASVWCRDLHWLDWCRDIDLMSRHGSYCPMVVWCPDRGVSVGEAKAGCDINLRSLPGLALRVSRQGFDVATWAFGCG